MLRIFTAFSLKACTHPIQHSTLRFYKFCFTLICIIGLIIPFSASAQTLAFPGAEGEARFATGGRGGQVYKVTNLNNSGPGSFREAAEASGPRIVIFEVGGTIHLTNALTIDNGDMTIAGQTAPGDGIAIADKIVKFRAGNIITRYVRFRGDGNDDCIELIATNGVETNDLIFDHVSISWGGDENVGSIGTNGGVRQVTFQDCISSEGIMDHSMGMLITKNNATEFDVIRCLFAYSNARNPKFASGSTGNCVNNVMAGYGNAGLRVDQNAQVNAIGNVAVNSLDDKKVITLVDQGVGGQPTMLYVKDNIGPGRTTNTGDDWLAVNGDPTYRVLTPAVPLNDIPSMDPEIALDYVLDNAGASLVRDAVDARIVDQVRNGTGGLITAKPAVPFLNGGAAPVDSDNDGMPDDWENTHGLNANDASDQNLDRTGDGWTNVEEYINSFGTGSPPPGNAAPTVSSIADQVTDQDVTIGPINFTVGDTETPAGSLTVTSSSSNTALVGNVSGDMVLGGSGASRNITITPKAGVDGTTVITIAVSDGTTSTSTTFLLTVNDVAGANTPPVIVSNITDQVTDMDVPVTLDITVDDAETPAADLVFTATSDNATLVPNGNLVVGGSGADRTLTITPVAGEIGTARITLVLSDGTDQDQGSFNFIVNDPGNTGPLTVSLSVTDVNCFDGSNGRITSTVTGGAAPYSYLWSNGGSSPGNSNLNAGTYTLTVTDADDNSVTETVDVTQPTEIVLSGSVQDATCNVADGSIDLSVSGGAGSYAYSWSNGATTASLSNVATGDYTVTVTDGNGCTKSETYNIGSGADFTFQVSIQNADCGSSNGSISLTVVGTGPYTYSWSNGATTSDISGLEAGTYAVVITDASGCDKSASFNVDAIPGVIDLDVVSDVSNVTCNGNDGSIALTVSGGVAPYSYDWSHGATTASTTGLIPGNYSVTITDANGCYMDWSTVLNSDPGVPKPEITQSGNTLTASAANSYQWYLDGEPIIGAIQQSHEAGISGDYSVKVWDENDCSALSDELTVEVEFDEDDNIIQLLELYPNPVRNDLNIKILINGEHNVAFRIFTLEGRPVSKRHFGVGKGSMETKLDLSRLRPGVYIIKIKVGDEVVSRRLVKM
ncbi:MAG: T9SS type A sorting domain-containing protein [Cyclobacteriaceae bacterium]|nr:T9SS type A sorting domain-containing protein [Cyclobacteriaceae bacterium]